MLPVDNTYGIWPMSGMCSTSLLSLSDVRSSVGEIDIMEARGNGPSYPKQ